MYIGTESPDRNNKNVQFCVGPLHCKKKSVKFTEGNWQPAASTCTVIFTGTRKKYLTWLDRIGQDSVKYGSVAI